MELDKFIKHLEKEKVKQGSKDMSELIEIMKLKTLMEINKKLK